MYFAAELDPNGGGFKDAMNWIVKLGSAARYGVQVMMRQPHMLSFHSPTHVSRYFFFPVSIFISYLCLIPSERKFYLCLSIRGMSTGAIPTLMEW